MQFQVPPTTSQILVVECDGDTITVSKGSTFVVGQHITVFGVKVSGAEFGKAIRGKYFVL